ncbi:MAG: hypothetical protein AAFW73_22345 [Bacteroidota bacterium]
MKPTFPSLWLVLTFCTLAQAPLSAQFFDQFFLEGALELNYSYFDREEGDLIELLDDFDVELSNQGRLGFGLGAYLGRPLTERLGLKLGLQVVSQGFRYRFDGLVTVADLLSNPDDPESSVWKVDYRLWNVEVPLVAEYALGANRDLLVALGGGARFNLSESGQSRVISSEGEVEDLDEPEFRTDGIQPFVQAGVGKVLPFEWGSGTLRLLLHAKYYLAEERNRSFRESGRLWKVQFQVAYRFGEGTD